MLYEINVKVIMYVCVIRKHAKIAELIEVKGIEKSTLVKNIAVFYPDD